MSTSCKESNAAAPCQLKKQRTIMRPVSRAGLGLFTGEKISLTLRPASIGSGILFQRIDLPEKPILPAQLKYVQGTPRCTMIGDQGVFIQTVEHLLAALRASEIDNAIVEISGSEVPIFDGSSDQFVKMIDEAGILIQEEGNRPVYRLFAPIYWSMGDIHLIALPSDEYRISYTLHYPHSKFLRSQYHSISVNEENFKSQISTCRTFSLYEEIVPMIEKGFIKSASLENGVVIKDDAVMNPEGPRFENEMVRHKILDVIGDLSLVGCNFIAHIIAIRSGHASNIAFARELQNHIKMENS